jgi:hypothetical protein
LRQSSKNAMSLFVLVVMRMGTGILGETRLEFPTLKGRDH